MSQEYNNNLSDNNSTTATHCHSSSENNVVDNQARNRLIAASLLCVTFMIAEIIGGYLANSLAIASDAAHLLTDFASFMISLFSIWFASRPATKNMSFGWYRAEVIGALTSVLMIWIVTGILVYIAVERLINRNYEIEALIMMITASLGVLVNIIMGAALHFGGVPHGHSHGSGSSHSHGSGSSHSHQHKHNHENSGKKNLNVRAAFIHVLGDFFQSLGVLIASIVIYFKPEWNFIDPICTFVFSIIVLVTTFNIIKDTLNIFMEGIPKNIDFLEVQRLLSEIPGVLKVHNLRIWSLSLDKTALAAHLAINQNTNPNIVLNTALTQIHSRFKIFESIIQVEEYKVEMNSCAKCKDPIV